jgi:hypothetical protein
MAEKAEEITNPIIIDKMEVQNKLAYGNAKANGAAPRMDAQMTYFLPILSPIGPPIIVPAATANRKEIIYSFEILMYRPNLSIN